jgi:hypothetical protein
VTRIATTLIVELRTSLRIDDILPCRPRPTNSVVSIERGRNTQQRQRMRSALLSALAALATAALLVVAVLSADDSTSRSWFVWIATIGVPPIGFSLVAAAQYRFRHSTGAGAAAAAVYWVFLIGYNVRAAGLFLIGTVLQTAAWMVSRPRSPRRDATRGRRSRSSPSVRSASSPDPLDKVDRLTTCGPKNLAGNAGPDETGSVHADIVDEEG